MDETLSLKMAFQYLENLLPNTPIKFIENILDENTHQITLAMPQKSIVCFENLRFLPEEEKGDIEFAKTISRLADVYVNDAFSCSHRAHASVDAITNFLPSFAGLLLHAELEHLSNHWINHKKPLIGIIGGGKVSSKIELLRAMVKKVDALVIGGAMANTFLKALKYNVGKSLVEDDYLSTALDVIEMAKNHACEILLPMDVVVVQQIKDGTEHREVDIDNVELDDIIVDIGPKTCALIAKSLQKSKTVVWNGPLGMFELKPFNKGTLNVAYEIAKLTQSGILSSIVGGGDTISAISTDKLETQITFVSTGGGAFLELLIGRALPGIEALSRCH